MAEVFDRDLIAMYQRQGLLDAAEQPRSLSRECPCAKVCWQHEPEQRRPPMHSITDELSAPWIGPAYDRSRLVVVLENLYDYGGWDLSSEATKGMRFLARAARVGFAKGDRRLFAGGGYKGTPVWAQAASYAAVLLSASHIVPLQLDGMRRVAGACLAAAIDHIVLTQHVKCSPVSAGNRSQPGAAMWNTCGRQVLQHELMVLRPRDLLVVGTGSNKSGIERLLVDFPWRQVATIEHAAGRRKLRLSLHEVDSPFGAVRIAFVPHPAAAGAASTGLVHAFIELLQHGRQPAR